MKSVIIALGVLLGGFSYAHVERDHQPPTAHLTFANGAIHAHATWLSGPEVYSESGLEFSESLLKIEWKNGADQTLIELPGAFEVELWMSDMNHGSTPTQIRQIFDSQGRPLTGVFEISNIYFVMGGDWDVNVTLNYQDGSKETQAIKVSLPVELDCVNSGHR